MYNFANGNFHLGLIYYLVFRRYVEKYMLLHISLIIRK